MPHGPHQASDKNNADKHQQGGTQYLSQSVRQLLRPECHCHGSRKKHHRIPELRHGLDRKASPTNCTVQGNAHLLKNREHRHLKGSAGGPGNGQARAYGEIDKKGKQKCKGRVHPACQLADAA